MVAAWQEAANQLGFRIEAPATVILQTGEAIEIEGFLSDFGSINGAYLVSNETKRHLLRDSGMWVSQLFESYQFFSADLWIETLSDWGWFGPGNRPDWLVPTKQ